MQFGNCSDGLGGHGVREDQASRHTIVITLRNANVMDSVIGHVRSHERTVDTRGICHDESCKGHPNNQPPYGRPAVPSPSDGHLLYEANLPSAVALERGVRGEHPHRLDVGGAGYSFIHRNKSYYTKTTSDALHRRLLKGQETSSNSSLWENKKSLTFRASRRVYHTFS